MPQVPKQRNITLQHNKQVRVIGTENRAKKQQIKKKNATCLTTLLKNELNSRQIARFTTQIKPVLQRIRL